MRQMPEEMWLHEIRPGAFAGDRTGPIPSVACYIPRGKGAFPSVALMTSIPAKVAGVKEVIIITPPGANGKIDDATLVAARMAGVPVFKPAARMHRRRGLGRSFEKQGH
jgi:histidinol dehydrogenase